MEKNDIESKLIEKLEYLSDSDAKQVLDYMDFLIWRKTGKDKAWLETDLSNLDSYDSYEWQPDEINQGLPVKYIPDVGVVIIEE